MAIFKCVLDKAKNEDLQNTVFMEMSCINVMANLYFSEMDKFSSMTDRGKGGDLT